jgi:hypothetical protein
MEQVADRTADCKFPNGLYQPGSQTTSTNTKIRQDFLKTIAEDRKCIC